MEKYNLKLDVFEGPLDLLMHLVEKNKLNIYDINISEIVEQYIEYLSLMQELDIEIASEFLTMATMLLLIKSNMLLPKLKIIAEENAQDLQEELLARLVEYRKFKEYAKILNELVEQQGKVRTREPVSFVRQKRLQNSLHINKLLEALANLFDKPTELMPYVRGEEVNINDKIERIIITLRERFLAGKIKTSFVELLETASVQDIVVTFMALLELAKQKKIVTEQEAVFSQLIISWLEV